MQNTLFAFAVTGLVASALSAPALQAPVERARRSSDLTTDELRDGKLSPNGCCRFPGGPNTTPTGTPITYSLTQKECLQLCVDTVDPTDGSCRSIEYATDDGRCELYFNLLAHIPSHTYSASPQCENAKCFTAGLDVCPAPVVKSDFYEFGEGCCRFNGETGGVTPDGTTILDAETKGECRQLCLDAGWCRSIEFRKNDLMTSNCELYPENNLIHLSGIFTGSGVCAGSKAVCETSC